MLLPNVAGQLRLSVLERLQRGLDDTEVRFPLPKYLQAIAREHEPQMVLPVAADGAAPPLELVQRCLLIMGDVQWIGCSSIWRGRIRSLWKCCRHLAVQILHVFRPCSHRRAHLQLRGDPAQRLFQHSYHSI